MQTTVSVIIPTYNRQHTLARAIDSVLSQQHQAHEIIVIDDGSTDTTEQWVKNTYPQITLLSQANKGVSSARNAGIAIATGEWIALLDSDDCWFKQKLKIQMALLQEHPEMRLCHSDEHWIRNGKRVNPMNKHKKAGGWIFQQCLPLCAISPSASLIHKSVFNELGDFDESLPACEDYDYWLRLCSREPVVYCEDALIEKYGGHEDQLSRQHWGMDRFRLAALAKLLRSHTANPFMRDEDYQSAIRTFNTKLSIYCQGASKRGRDEHVLELKHQYNDILQYTTA